MIISNRSLLIAIVAVIIVSFVGTFLSVSSFSSLMSSPEFPSTGHASSGSGNVTMQVTPYLSITTADSSSINFSGCRANSTIYSNVSGGNADAACPGFVPGEIIVRNDGTYLAEVTFVSSDWGEAHNGSFLNSTSNSSWVAYKVANASSHPLYTGGCFGSFSGNWTNITNSSEYVACDNLSNAAPMNSFEFDIAIFIPPRMLPGQNNVSFTFLARKA